MFRMMPDDSRSSISNLAQRLYLSLWRGEAPPEATQRRSHRRSPCRLGLLCHAGDESFRIHVLDASQGGIRARLPRRLAPGMLVHLEAPDLPGHAHDSLSARVAWCRQREGRVAIEAGFTFLAAGETLRESWLQPLMRTLDPNAVQREARAHLRVPTDLRSEVAIPGDPTRDAMPGRIVNLSCGGILFEGEHHFEVGDGVTVMLEVPRRRGWLVCRGEVVRSRWRAPGRCHTAIQWKDLSHEDMRALRDIVEAELGAPRLLVSA